MQDYPEGGELHLADGVHSFLRKPKESGRRGSCEKDFVSRQHHRYALSWQCLGLVGWNMGEKECHYGYGERVCQFITMKSSVTLRILELCKRKGSRKRS